MFEIAKALWDDPLIKLYIIVIVLFVYTHIRIDLLLKELRDDIKRGRR